MKFKKIMFSGFIVFNLSLAVCSGSYKNIIYAQSENIIYKAFAERITFADRYFNFQWGLDNDGTLNYTERIGGTYGTVDVEAAADTDIDFPEVRAVYSGGKQETVVAVIDTGADYNHEDLQNVVWVNKNEIPGNGIDDDNNGYIDDVNGWNFYDENNVIYSGKESSHGTHVAGIIGANINSIGVAGIAGSSTVKVMILKALGGDDGSGYTYGVIDAIKYAEKMGASICNFSFGTDIPDKNLEKVIRESKMLFVVASGNGDENKVGYSIDTKPMYPASYSYDNLISVANLQADGRLHPSSNYGYNSVDIAAPGARILSTIDSETYNLNYSSVNLPTPYAYMTGTSMSAPFVAGVAALIYSDFPGINAAQAKETILNSTKSLSALTGLVNTGGMVSAERAYNYANDNYRRFLESNKAEEIKEEAETEVKEAAKEDTEEGSDNKQENTDKNETVKKDTKEEKKVKQSKKGTRPAISFLITKTGKLKIKMSDKDIAEVRYASGNKSSSYFNKARKGIKIKLNSKNEKSLTLKKGTYTFYVIDKKGNRRIERVVIK